MLVTVEHSTTSNGPGGSVSRRSPPNGSTPARAQASVARGVVDHRREVLHRRAQPAAGEPERVLAVPAAEVEHPGRPRDVREARVDDRPHEPPDVRCEELEPQRRNGLLGAPGPVPQPRPEHGGPPADHPGMGDQHGVGGPRRRRGAAFAAPGRVDHDDVPGRELAEHRAQGLLVQAAPGGEIGPDR